MYFEQLPGPLCLLIIAHNSETTSACCPAVWISASCRSAKLTVLHGRPKGEGSDGTLVGRAAALFREVMPHTR